ncbi:MAG TPA: protein kinase [Gemmatimonadaceae bacterium]|nr:protein kinase [Gemmatimonadaceae bacterium]
MTVELLDRLRSSLRSTYTIDRELGGGGMSHVFVADDPRLHRTIVVKVLKPELAEGLSAQRFEREIGIAARLQHPNIVPVLNAGETGGLPYYTMPFVRGESLRTHLARGRMDSRASVRILADVARALAYAHDEGVVHRDVKPENVLVSDGIGVVTDFGIAKAIDAARLDRDEAGITQLGTAVGTPAYMAPEQATGDPDVDHRADLYAWGVVAYECLAGAHPFADRTSSRELITAHLIVEPAPLAALGQVSPAVAAVVMRCLAKDPADRPRSARDLIAALDGGDGGGDAVDKTRGNAPSIAVMPFVNLSADPQNDYFSDGITEELLILLAQDGGLRVAARSSSFAFKGRDVDLRTVADRLNVGAILEGSVRRAGARVRVTVRLVNAVDGYQLWSERFERELTDIFALQDEIAAAIAATLRDALRRQSDGTAVTPARPFVARARGSANVEAYEAYLRGRFHLHRRADGMHEARMRFEQALALDPDFAEAHAGLANSLLWLGTHAALAPGEAFAHMRRHAEQALSLDPDLSDAHYLLGYVALFYDWDVLASERHVRRALAIQPGNADALMLASYLAVTHVRRDEALRLAASAMGADPVGLATRIGVLSVYYLCSEFARAIDLSGRVLADHPGSGEALRFRAMSLYVSGDLPRARADLEQAAAQMRRSPFILSHLAMVHVLEGHPEEAVRLRDELLARSATEAVPPIMIALAHQALGDYDEALIWYDRAIQMRDFLMIWLHVAPLFLVVPPSRSRPITDDPRWAALVAQVGLAPQTRM